MTRINIDEPIATIIVTSTVLLITLLYDDRAPTIVAPISRVNDISSTIQKNSIKVIVRYQCYKLVVGTKQY